MLPWSRDSPQPHMDDSTRHWIDQDHTHGWHPFTRQQDWCAQPKDTLVITKAEGAWLWDSEGQRYLDGNSSIWTNIHGHSHPTITRAIQQQAATLDHSSFLGATHPGAVELATKLCALFPEQTLERVFFSDNGSTAIECALKMAIQYHQQTGAGQRTRFAAFANSYHGDTLGAASTGGVSRFFKRFKNCGYEVEHVCDLTELDQLNSDTLAAVVIEPLIQGVNEMRPWPAGMLKQLREWCTANRVQLILDEVMTGFGRTGTLFACQQEDVIPDYLCLAKGLTGGTLPLAATLTTETVYQAFLGKADKAFYYGHSYTANPLGCAAALANLRVFEEEQTLEKLPAKIDHLKQALGQLKDKHPHIHEIRQCGLIAGIELRNPDGESFPTEDRIGENVCLAAREHELLTRPILDTLVLMPPLSCNCDELDHAISAISNAISNIMDKAIDEATDETTPSEL